MKKPIKGAIFDLDGTLLLSMHVWDSVGSNYLRSAGVQPDDDTDMILKVTSVEEAATYYRNRYGLAQSAREITDAINGELVHQYFDILGPKEGAMAMLAGLKAKGVKMIAATATDRELIEPCLARNGILPYLEGVLTVTEVGIGKTDPLIYRQATEILGVQKEEIAVFEDALYAARTVKRDGFTLIGIYDDSMREYQEELKTLADLYVPDYLSVDVVKALTE